MKHEDYEAILPDVLGSYNFPGNIVSCEEFGNGYINGTFRVTCDVEGKREHFTVQKINHEVFKKPEELMENIFRVTSFLAEKIRAAGGDEKRETLNIVKTADGKLLYTHKDGTFWRVYTFVEDVYTCETVSNPDDLYNAAFSFGNFQKQLSDFPADTLHETIPNFHNTPVRFAAFEKAVKDDMKGRAASVKNEIDFFLAQKNAMWICADALAHGKLPLRVTHNDTKINNVLIDNATGKGLCVIDLDTVMPGLAGFDFGDLIRSGTSTGAEDEPDLEKVQLDVSLFEAAAKGFVEGCGGALTDAEISMLVDAAKNIVLEQGIRFLGDYLNGDTYYKISHQEQNLYRARTQLKLVQEIDRKRKELDKIIEN